MPAAAGDFGIKRDVQSRASLVIFDHVEQGNGHLGRRAKEEGLDRLTFRIGKRIGRKTKKKK